MCIFHQYMGKNITSNSPSQTKEKELKLPSIVSSKDRRGAGI